MSRERALSPRSKCFTCERAVGDKSLVFFGPGAFVRCEKCGAWDAEALVAGAAAFAAWVERFWNPPAEDATASTAPVFGPKKRRGRPPGLNAVACPAPPAKTKRTTRAGMVRFEITTDPSAEVA